MLKLEILMTDVNDDQPPINEPEETIELWKQMLAGYDAQIEWFRGIKIETFEESIRRQKLMELHPEKSPRGDMAEWQALNPKLPSITIVGRLESSR